MEKLKMHSPDLTQDNIARLRELFPDCVTEAAGEDGGVWLAVDFDQLRQALSDALVEGPQERYRLDWPGKREALLAANAPIAKTLRPCREESVDFDTTQNLFIEGDNLDALKLLQETYLGKVKMIYIDPPYNTGKDFIYRDNYAASREEFEKSSGERSEAGRLVSNPDSHGRYHSDWLSMIYSRLTVAKRLLSEEGVIFISIGDEEQASLKKVCDQVFGEENFVATVVWQKVYSPMNSATQFASVHDYLHVYARNARDWTANLLPRTKEQDKAYKNIDNDPRGPWKAENATAAAGHATQSQFYELVTPEGNRFTPPSGRAWLYTESQYQKMLDDNRIWFGRDGMGRPAIKRFLSEVKQGRVAQTFWPYTEVGHNQDAKRELLSRVKFSSSDTVFDTPKPTKLIKRMLMLATNPCGGDIVMDFFAGSSSTADAVFQQNAEDGGSRRFVMVQLDEESSSEEEATTGSLSTIVRLSQERIRCAGRNIKEENANKEGIDNLDTGFRVLKIDTSNMADVYYRSDALEQGDLLGHVANVKPDRSGEDLLFQVLLDWGVDLGLPIVRETVDGREVFFVDDNALAACFVDDGSVDEDFVKQLAARKPLRVVFRDAGFANDNARINVEQIFKTLSPATDVRTL